MKVGIIGLGRWGKKLLKIFDNLLHVKIISHKNNPKTGFWVKKYFPHVLTTLNYHDILHDKSIDAVIIATPINTHYQIAIDALVAKKHVFIEKPIAESRKECNELLKMSKNKILFVGHTFLFDPCYRKLKEISLNDKPYKVDLDWNKMGTFDEDLVDNLLSHDIAIIGDLLGFSIRNIKVNALNGYLSDIDYIDLSLDNGKNTKCQIKIDRVNPINQKLIRIECSSGDLYYWTVNKIYRLNKEKRKLEIFYESKKDALELECLSFITCVETKIPPITDGFFGMEVVSVLDKIKRLCIPSMNNYHRP